MQIIVASALGADATQSAVALFPDVVAECHEGGNVFELRAVGAARADGQLIAIIEDHTVVANDWASSLLAAYAQGHNILGGPVVPGEQRGGFDWALYLVEYGVYMPPVVSTTVHAVSGVNVAYDARSLRSVAAVWQSALMENEVNDALAQQGVHPYMVSSAALTTDLPLSLIDGMRHLFDGGRHFATYRATRASLASRVGWLVGSPLLPVIFFVRIVRRTFERQPSRIRHIVRGFPYLAVLLAAWSAGEAAGYAGMLRSARVGNS